MKPRDENMIRVILCFSVLALCPNRPHTFAEETTSSQDTSNISTNATTITQERNEEATDTTKQDGGINLSILSTKKTGKPSEDKSEGTLSSKNRDKESTEDLSKRTPSPLSSEQDQDMKVIIRDDPTKNISNSRRQDDINVLQELNKTESSYLGKLTGNLLLPALRTQHELGKAWGHANEGIKNIGTGTYEAAAGTFNFFRDAALAVIRSG